MFEKYMSLNPKVTHLPECDMKPETGMSGIKALMYEGIEYHGKKTAVFAYLGLPEMKENEKVPAVILVHGGGGIAYAEWIKLWNDRGFAAIAMSLRGHFPRESERGRVVTEGEEELRFERFCKTEEYAAHPDGYCIYGEDIENVWLYQAVANTILAHNILRKNEHIDSKKIGITGISWGGIITSQVIAYDRRFAFAIPIYGSGHMDKSLSFVGEPFHCGKAKKAWDISDKYSQIGFPVYWLCSNYDACFDIAPNSLCYLQTRQAGAVFTAAERFFHSHIDGWSRRESYRFAESIVGKAKPLVHPITEPCGKGELSFEISDGKNVKATLYYLTAPMRFTSDSRPDYEWKTIPCKICGNTVRVNVPYQADNYYVELTEIYKNTEFVTTTSYIKG